MAMLKGSRETILTLVVMLLVGACGGVGGTSSTTSTAATTLLPGSVLVEVSTVCAQAATSWLSEIESIVVAEGPDDWSAVTPEELEGSTVFQDLMTAAREHEAAATAACSESDRAILFPGLITDDKTTSLYPGAGEFFEFAREDYAGEQALWFLCPIWPFCRGGGSS